VAEDRNQNVKKQLLKKRDEATRKKIPLAPGEMVDDALARALAGSMRWLKANFGAIQWVILGLIALGIGYVVYDWRSVKRAEAASNELLKGTVAEKGRISGTSSPKPEDGMPDDPTPVFKSLDERRDTALASYRKVTSSYPGSGAAILARLGEAGVLLDKRNWDGALAAYRDVKNSPLAAADPTVRGATLEGIGLALEGKGEIEEALRSFHELEGTNVAGQKELAQYHQARILFAKGDVDKAKDLLKSAKDHIKGHSTSSSAAPEARPFAFLESQIDDLLRRIDPTAVPSTPPPGAGAGSMSPEDMQRFQQEMQRRMAERKQKAPPSPAPAGSP
jgi:hypothetical protein